MKIAGNAKKRRPASANVRTFLVQRKKNFDENQMGSVGESEQLKLFTGSPAAFTFLGEQAADQRSLGHPPHREDHRAGSRGNVVLAHGIHHFVE